MNSVLKGFYRTWLDQKIIAPCFTPYLLVSLLKYFSSVPSCKVIIIRIYMLRHLKIDIANVKPEIQSLTLIVESFLIFLIILCFLIYNSDTFGGKSHFHEQTYCIYCCIRHFVIYGGLYIFFY